MAEYIPLTALSGIGEKTAQKFAAARINSVEDLITYYPRTYDCLTKPAEEISETADGTLVAVCGFIVGSLALRYAGRFKILTGTLQTKSGSQIQVTWFNMPYLKNSLQPGKVYVMRGYAKRRGKRMGLSQPKIYDPQEYERLLAHPQPIYPLTEGLTEHRLRSAVHQALTFPALLEDYLPAHICKAYELAQYGFACKEIHFPTDLHHCVVARRRIVFDEFLLFILALKRMKESESLSSGIPMKQSSWSQALLASLPYRLTKDQQQVWEEVKRDLSSGKLMSRLLQGDVGSGKTIIAFLAMLCAVENGYQAALMVPTEVLARQHYEGFAALTSDLKLPVETLLLTGSLTAAQKRQAAQRIMDGTARVIIGTHALIQQKVSYQNLGLVITDEQHRFGVRQREQLSEKGVLPHILVMSATPIPRTLAVILYGDLDVSVIHQLPANRLPIKNCVVKPGSRKTAYQFILRQVREGHQAYVICAMVEENENMEAENVLDYTQRLKGRLPGEVKVGTLHGRMRPAEKNEVMDAFVQGRIQVLVSTTVVEVGVNVPNATVMMIEDAQRFGLAQLHQLRGRVGRGAAQSYCIMIDSSGEEKMNPRLEIMNKSNDGFEIARQDLKLRGPGDLFGIRQSGLIDFKMGDVFSDAEILQDAARAAEDILREDGTLQTPMYEKLREKLLSYSRMGQGNVSI